MQDPYDLTYHLIQMQEAIRYLEFCVEKLGNRETAIHNFLLSLYAKQSDKTLLLKYLYKYSKVCQYVCVYVCSCVHWYVLQVDAAIPYDARYALRVCQEVKGLDRACVHIYSVMGLLEEAVQLALTVFAK